MRITRPTNEESLPYNVIKIFGCSDSTVGFDILNQQPTVSKRRYCNKVLVHECVTVPVVDPIDLSKAEFLATDDPCYSFFNIYKSSDTVEDLEPTIELQLNDDDLVIGILVNFKTSETSCVPLQMAYRLYGYSDDTRILLSQGTLLITPCSNTDNCNTSVWTGISW